jgi:hypothetical protein
VRAELATAGCRITVHRKDAGALAHDHLRHDVNYAFGALWGGWLLFWLASARGKWSPAWAYIGLAMVAVLLIAKLKAEEVLLSRQFPAAYLEYRRRVKAMIPLLY